MRGDSEEEEEVREVEALVFYDVTDRGGVVMDARGKEVMEYMRGVVSNMYRNCFLKFKDQDSRLVREVLESVHSRYPNPPQATFSDVWGRTRIREILSNKRSHLKKLAYDDGVNVAAGGYPCEKPATAHKREWKEAKKRAEGGVKSRQHVEARRIQMETIGSSHFGSGGVESWEAEFVSNLLLYLIVYFIH